MSRSMSSLPSLTSNLAWYALPMMTLLATALGLQKTPEKAPNEASGFPRALVY